MELVVRKDLSQWVAAADEWLMRQKSSGAESVYLPAGETPKPIYELWRSSHALQNLKLVQIDEILSVPEALSFKLFFKQSLGGKLLVEACDRMDALCDVGILGLGTNGHVGFHEPGIDKSMYSGCVPLDQHTCNRLQIPVGSWGVTYGLGAFLKCRALLLIVRGEKSKSKILKRILEGDKSLPATHLLEHEEITILSDFSI
jgi:glucosamine-6-phosphate deaminase